jgi:N,N'-diacetyllegionaminate synthase
MSLFIIAEAGSCHEGSLDRARQLVSVAHSAGADAVKYQFWSSPQRMQERRHLSAPAYEEGSIPQAWLETLRKECHDRKLLFGATVYLPEDIPILRDVVDYWKVSSFESRDRELTRAIPTGRPLFISTGMQEAHDDGYLPKRGIRLHCVSAYPCPPYEANLGAIMLGQGYSDHTCCVFTGAFAVSAGAEYLEVHYRLDDTSSQCPDFPVSLSPEGLSKYIALAREAWKMRGDGQKHPQAAERENMAYRVRE